MNELINQQRALYAILNITGWRQPYPLAVAGSSRGSMEDALPKRKAPHNQDQNKRRRLSRLLDKLAVQLNNNNHYPTPSWLTVNRHLPQAKFEPENADEAPLDLSIKSVIKAPTPEPSFLCNYCGQNFSVHDRLAKHIASRHRSKPDAVRTYECEICLRKFARSDMLTRHARLHSGVKPYCCNVCGQVFSRSDHLATHQRTHTGEKPYKCPTCPYAACRRDMITRHMRTHTRRTQPV